MDYQNRNNNSLLSLKDVFFFFKSNFWLIFATTFIISLSSLIYALYLNNIYQSKSVLISNSSLNRINQSSQVGLSGFSSLASLGLGSSGESLSNLDLAYETLKSRTFFERLAKDNDFVRDLSAIKSYDQNSKSFLYDKSIYDIVKNKWIANVPSTESLHKKFNSQVIFIERDRKKGFIILSVRALSPQLSYQWHRMIVDELNEAIRISDVEKAQKNLDFLKSLSETENSILMKQTIATLMSIDIKKIMLSNSSEDYSLEFLDKPFIPEKRIYPRRTIICVIGFIGGLMIGIFASILRSFIKK